MSWAEAWVRLHIYEPYRVIFFGRTWLPRCHATSIVCAGVSWPYEELSVSFKSHSSTQENQILWVKNGLWKDSNYFFPKYFLGEKKATRSEVYLQVQLFGKGQCRFDPQGLSHYAACRCQAHEQCHTSLTPTRGAASRAEPSAWRRELACSGTHCSALPPQQKFTEASEALIAVRRLFTEMRCKCVAETPVQVVGLCKHISRIDLVILQP